MYKASNQAGRQHGYIRVSELSDRKKYRRVLKAVDAGELVKVRHGVYAPPEEMLNNIIDVESIVPGGVYSVMQKFIHLRSKVTQRTRIVLVQHNVQDLPNNIKRSIFITNEIILKR